MLWHPKSSMGHVALPHTFGWFVIHMLGLVMINLNDTR